MKHGIAQASSIASADADYRKGIRWSLYLHGGLILFVLVKSLVFPGKPMSYVPTLRVDIVGLPDVLKKDLTNAARPVSPEIKKVLEKTEPEPEPVKPVSPKRAPKTNVEKAKPDEMVLKPKHSGNSERRRNKLKSALARIKALEKISSLDNAPVAAPVIKGNMISKGTSLSGDARESSEASYFDSLRDRLQGNWALPVWIARQNLSAQVRIYIDGRGRLRNFKFMKSSGNTQFDNAVKQTISESQPFPLPPEDLASTLLVDGILVGFPL